MASYPVQKFRNSNNHWDETIYPNPAFMTNNSMADAKPSYLKNQKGDHKCQVYVHQYNKISNRTSNNYLENWQSGNEIYQHLYKHEFSDYYDAKVRLFRKQFDSLSLNSSAIGQQNNTNNKRISKSHHNSNDKGSIPEQSISFNQSRKISNVKSNSNAKISKALFLKPENKAAIDKLEERYWAKWKPTRDNRKEHHPKAKGLYTENDIVKPATFNPGNKSSVNINTRKESGDLKEETLTCCSETESTQQFQTIANETTINKDLITENAEENINESHANVCDQSQSNQSTIPVINEETEPDCATGTLKHTDSFILTSKKQNQDKPRFQQPKCIKLFKNAGYTRTAPTIRIKGGTYPLKSCLKNKSSTTRASSLGRPGSPINVRKPGKANRFTK